MISDLGVWRTPVEPAPRLAQWLGLRAGDLWIKRDDWLGHGGGGNKLRKLEHLCGEAVAAGATTLVTSGAAQSNYARLTAASARRLGLDVVLCLHAGSGTGQPDARRDLRRHGGLGRRSGGDRGRDPRSGRPALRRARARPARAAISPARTELREQAPDARHVVVAVGSWRDHGGPGRRARRGARARRRHRRGRRPGAAHGVLTELGASADGLRLRLDQVAPGYEQLNDAARAAIEAAGRLEGLVLDPVYTAKAMAGLKAAVDAGEITPGEKTVFVHTGGLPGLFGHPYAAELSGSVLDQ